MMALMGKQTKPKMSPALSEGQDGGADPWSRLPRLRELTRAVCPSTEERAYLQETELTVEGPRFAALLELEGVLEELDDENWSNLSKRAAKTLLVPRHRLGRGWQPLHDVFNEARAYVYLKRLGCERARAFRWEREHSA